MSRPRRFQDARQAKRGEDPVPTQRPTSTKATCAHCGAPMQVTEYLVGQLVAPTLDVCQTCEEGLRDEGRLCPHGRPPAECNACLVDSDLAYDAWREDHVFGRR